MPRRDLVRTVAVAVAIAAISALHYLTPPSHAVLHAIYQRGYYLPIIAAAYWYGVRGGLLAAAFSDVAYLPHIEAAWADNPAYAASQYAELFVFVLLGVAVGLIATHGRRLADRARRSAESLEASNRELRESQEHLRRAERLSALGEVSAGLAHEVRNPLAGIKGALEIIAGRVQPGTPEAEFSAIAAAEVSKLDRLVSEFLGHARARPPERRQTDLGALARHVAALLQPGADRAGVTIHLEVAGRRAPSAFVDPGQVEQVLFNVALNAIQASPRGAHVTIAVRAADDSAVIEVLDRGPGVPPERLARVFEPFYTTKSAGTGLGLAISQRIVKAHGGRIRVEPRPGGGTLVSFDLPLGGSAPAGSQTDTVNS